MLETRAETVTKLKSGGEEPLREFLEMELSEERELVAVTRGFVPFTDTSGGASVVSVCFSAPLSGGDVTEEGEEANVSDTGPGWTGGGGARYLTLVDSD